MRQLASIQKIIEIKPIEGADAIEVATALGWHVVVKKGEFNVGGLCVYIEIDSILPERDEFKFLEKSKYRIKTVRLRGQVSQGICFPLTILGTDFPYANVEEGQDVTDILGITKYEMIVPAHMSGKIKGNFPSFIPKTDEPRLQNFPYLLGKYKDVKFVVTEKVDGSSTTFFLKDDEFHVCSRNLDLLEDSGNTIWQIARSMDIEYKMRSAHIGDNIAIQGEIIGQGIQGNRLGVEGKTILFFNAYDFKNGTYLSFHQFTSLMNSLGLAMVPTVANDVTLLESVDEMVVFATRRTIYNSSNAWIEGLVWRPLQEEMDDKLGRLSFKVVNPEFLLKNDN